MAEEWFYAHEGQEFGPFTTSQLKRLGAAGQIRPTDLVWKAGMVKRVPAKSVKGLCPEAARAATPPGRTPAPAAPAEEVIELIAVDAPSTPTQAHVSTQVDEVVELVSAEPVPPTTAPYPPQGQYAQAPPPPAAPPLRGVPVAEAEQLEPYDDEPRRPRGRRRKQAGSLLWLWLLLGGVGLLLVVGGVVLVILLAGSGSVTRENFDKLSAGMSENEVRGVLGSPSRMMNLGMSKTLIWQRGDNIITVGLMNDRVFMATGVFGGETISFTTAPNLNPNFGAPNFGGPNIGIPKMNVPNPGRPGFRR
jgi:hypothetical protein